ncbi:MAG: hypothetical protein JST22_19880 [Bacteroidetes bacterium]|nr:hypothetical protein [Bacteroidota bacterium]
MRYLIAHGIRTQCCCLIALAAASAAIAQSSETIAGACGGYETGELHLTIGTTDFSGTSTVHAHWPDYGLFLWRPSIVGESFGAQLRVGRYRTDGSFVHDFPATVVLLDGVGVTQRINIVHRVDLETLEADLLATYELPAGFAVGLGPTASYHTTMNGKVTQNLVEPENARFLNPGGLPTENNGRTLVLRNGEWPNRNKVTFGLTGSLMYTWRIDDWLAIIPEAHARHEFTDFSPDLSRNGLIFGGGLNVALIL